MGNLAIARYEEESIRKRVVSNPELEHSIRTITDAVTNSYMPNGLDNLPFCLCLFAALPMC